MGTFNYTYTLTNGTTADATQVMQDFNDVRSVVNGNIDHNNMLLTDNFTWTGKHTFSGADKLILPTSAPTVSDSVGHVNKQINIYDGSNVRYYAPVDNDSNGIYNLGLKLSAGALSITGRGNTALAASNAAWVSYPSSTGGSWLDQTVTADQTIASGGIKGRWGTTASIAWGSDMPFGIYVTSKDDTASGIRFFIARQPNMTTTPASTNNIGIDGTAPTTSDQANIVLFGSTANTGYNSRPCRLIGTCRMTCDNTAGGVWTVTALGNQDGIGSLINFQGAEFTMPTNQNGAAASTYFKANGGTAPTFTAANDVRYKIGLDGMVDFIWDMENTAGGTAGATAVNALLALPYAYKTARDLVWGTFDMTGTSISTIGVIRTSSGDTGSVLFEYQTTIKTAAAFVQNSDFAATTRSCRGMTRYEAF